MTVNSQSFRISAAEVSGVHVKGDEDHSAHCRQNMNNQRQVIIANKVNLLFQRHPSECAALQEKMKGEPNTRARFEFKVLTYDTLEISFSGRIVGSFTDPEIIRSLIEEVKAVRCHCTHTATDVSTVHSAPSFPSTAFMYERDPFSGAAHSFEQRPEPQMYTLHRAEHMAMPTPMRAGSMHESLNFSELAQPQPLQSGPESTDATLAHRAQQKQRHLNDLKAAIAELEGKLQQDAETSQPQIIVRETGERAQGIKRENVALQAAVRVSASTLPKSTGAQQKQRDLNNLKEAIAELEGKLQQDAETSQPQIIVRETGERAQGIKRENVALQAAVRVSASTLPKSTGAQQKQRDLNNLKEAIAELEGKLQQDAETSQPQIIVRETGERAQGIKRENVALQAAVRVSASTLPKSTGAQQKQRDLNDLKAARERLEKNLKKLVDVAQTAVDNQNEDLQVKKGPIHVAYPRTNEDKEMFVLAEELAKELANLSLVLEGQTSPKTEEPLPSPLDKEGTILETDQPVITEEGSLSDTAVDVNLDTEPSTPGVREEDQMDLLIQHLLKEELFPDTAPDDNSVTEPSTDIDRLLQGLVEEEVSSDSTVDVTPDTEQPTPGLSEKEPFEVEAREEEIIRAVKEIPTIPAQQEGRKEVQPLSRIAIATVTDPVKEQSTPVLSEEDPLGDIFSELETFTSARQQEFSPASSVNEDTPIDTVESQQEKEFEEFFRDTSSNEEVDEWIHQEMPAFQAKHEERRKTKSQSDFRNMERKTEADLLKYLDEIDIA